MKVSLKGLIHQSSALLDRAGDNGPGYAFTLREMYRNLDEAFERYAAGDPSGIFQFMRLYDMEKKSPPETQAEFMRRSV